MKDRHSQDIPALDTPEDAREKDLLQEQITIANALLQSQERDRQRIAADLHDNIGQNLSAVKMTIESVLRGLPHTTEYDQQRRALNATLLRIRMTVDELRRIALDLRPPMLEELGLLATLDWCCREFAELNPELHLRKSVQLEEQDIYPSLRCDIYRLVQEALHNVSKHASANNVEIILNLDDENLYLRIHDDGCGFRAKRVKGSGIGLYSMQARAKRWGGEMNVSSAIRAGTKIEFRWSRTALVVTGGAAEQLAPGVPTPGEERRLGDRRGRQ